MKKILLACLVFSIWYLVFGASSVFARCFVSVSDPPSLNCPSGYSCQLIPFPATTGPACTDPNSGDCWCVSNDPNNTPTPAPTSSPSPSSSPSSSLPPSFQIACNSGNSGDKDSRPVACESCSQTTLLTPACASNFSLIDSVNYQKSDAGIMCNNQHWLEKEWGGTITIDPNNTKVPYVGKKGQENEQKYLADYFEGTQYYKPQLDLSTCSVCQTDPLSQGCQTCQQKLQDIILTAGVWPKLAPTQLQDDYKRQIIDRAQKGEIHDYKVEYGGQSAVLTEFTTHLKPQQKDFTSPDAYQNNLNSWKASDNGKWSTLWTAVPMFSREDTPGEITPELAKRPADTVSRQSQAEQVPHLARLYEVTGALQKLLVPFSSPSPTPTPTPISQINNNNKTTVAFTPAELNDIYSQKSFAYQSQGKVLAGNTSFYGCKFYYGNNTDPRDCSCMGRIKPDGSNECRSEDPNQQCCPPHGFFGICGWGDCKLDGPDAHCQSKNIPQNGCPFVDIINYPPETPQPPVILCGLGGPKSIPNCSPQEALTDPNPNDTICCQNMKISLSAVDTFANTQYPLWQSCLAGCDDKLARGVIKETSNCWANCDGTVSEPVSRGMAVNLQHPYLKEIWQQTAEITSGLFNIFRPQTTEKFPDTPAKSTIDYSFDDPKNPAAHAEPPTGDFYFPHLGGIQKAKEFVLNLLNPSGGSSTGSNPGGVNPTPTPTPATITIDYVIQYRDPTAITITPALKQRIIDNVKANSNWKDTTQIEQYFDFVVSEAVKPENGGWNPAFVLALWIEESGANAINNAWGLGCGVTTGVAKDIQSQLPCLFNVSYKNADFKNFMCKYSDGLNATYPCSFKNNPNFVAGIKTWYDCTTGVSCPYK